MVNYPLLARQLQDGFYGLPATPAELEDHLFGMQAVTYSTVAALFFLIYDVAITFDDEVKYIWPISWGATKIDFFFIRYFPILFLISIQFYGTPRFTYSNHDCYIWNTYQALATILIIAAVDYILLLRVFALYPGNRRIKYLTWSLYFAELITASVGLGLGVPHLRYDQFCGVFYAPTTFFIAAGVPIVFQVYLFVITTCKFIRAVKSGWGTIPILKIIMRDSTWAFTLLFLILVTEAFLYTMAKDAYIGILFGWLNAAFSFCGYRILININRVGRIRRDATRTEDFTDGDIEFTTRVSTNPPESLGG
ncbi:hypothetical protein FA15DRAFT_624407 [Coprinopsis marcescibilis]|uniref:DUF6533 domain-containing protein n=1 Tax=Coprinopsis marcescibilis TaxID=230819 RepID=A0A5C3KLM6_COPMA|nr:hypothetical protein FA15DRAFT_624407 [Coprinopsis marcescibilis]